MMQRCRAQLNRQQCREQTAWVLLDERLQVVCFALEWYIDCVL